MVAAHEARVTRELPAIDLVDAENEATAAPEHEGRELADARPSSMNDFGSAGPEEFDEGATREVAAVFAPPVSLASAEPDATVVRAAVPASETMDVRDDEAPSVASAAPVSETPTPRPRFNTLAGAFSRARATPPPADPVDQPAFEAAMAGADTDIMDEVDPEIEWSVADQPTIQLSPEDLRALRPSFLDTGERPSSWPPRPQLSAPAPDPRPQEPTRPRNAPQSFYGADERGEPRDWRTGLPPRPQPPFPLDNLGRSLAPGERLAAPDGRAAHLAASSDAAPDYRMERFQELRRHRVAHEQGEATTDDVTPIADAVRQWWKDLRPDVGSALRFQHEARASGTHPLPAYAPPAPTSRLGDAFGRLAASAREVTGRAQQVAAPAFKRIHDQVEQAAQGIIQRFEGDTARQQAPLLGPGRVAIFFRRGVTVGQAQRLLAASSARPMRLIPRKHGILAQVMPGLESEIGERLRQHPYVDDVVYMQYDERGEPRNAGR